MIVEAGKSKICRVDPQAGDPGEPTFQSKGWLLQHQEEPVSQVKSDGCVLENSLLPWGGQSFCSIEAFN